MIPRRSLLLADIGNGAAAMACFNSAKSAALSASSRSMATIYKGTKRRLLCCHFVQGDHRSGLSQRPGERSTPTHRSPGHSFRKALAVQAAAEPCGGGSSLGPDHRRVRIGNADSAAGLFGRAPLSRTYARQARRSSRSGNAVSSSSMIAAKKSGCLLSCTTGGLSSGSISMPSNSRLPASIRCVSRLSGTAARQQRRRAHM